MKRIELHTQKYLREHGLARMLAEFKLKCTVYDKKVLIKYSQIESPMEEEIVRECRGLILERDTWEVMNYSFYKFFNLQEGHAANIDWDTAHILEKLDGSLIQLYWDWHKEKWMVATSGMAEAEGQVNNMLDTTFNELFWNTLEKMGIDFHDRTFAKGYSYSFELTTPYNVVVKPHATSSVTLLAMRDLKSLEELPYNQMRSIAKGAMIPFVKRYDLNQAANSIMATFKDMPWDEEGYVVVDANFNRVKLKNPAYVAVHHTKGKLGEHHIMEVIKTNEVDEVVAVFTERKEEIYELEPEIISKGCVCVGAQLYVYLLTGE